MLLQITDNSSVVALERCGFHDLRSHSSDRNKSKKLKIEQRVAITKVLSVDPLMMSSNVRRKIVPGGIPSVSKSRYVANFVRRAV